MNAHKTVVTILVVDDFRDNLEVFEAMLSDVDIRVLTCESGAEALRTLKESETALAIIDVNMPQMDGFALAQNIRSSEHGREIPIIFVTAGCDPRRVMEAYAIGAVDFMVKPIEAKILRSKVDVFVELYRQKKRLAEQLEHDRELMRVTQLFVAAIGHDLRSPLQTVITGSSLLFDRAPNEQAQGITRRIQSAGLRMSRLISDLMDFCNMRLTGSFSVSPSTWDIRETAVKVIEELRVAGVNTPLHLTYQGAFEVTWDETRVIQVLTNLIMNAASHGDGTGIEVSIQASDVESVEILVQNGGVIAPELLPDIFKPFQTSSHGRHKNSGLGLGLYIVAQIVEAHGGTIEVRSEAGTGTEFVFRMPRYAKPGSAKTFGHTAAA